MKNNLCLFERFSKFSIGLILLTFSLALVLSGFTVFPFFGFMVAIPFFIVAVYFFRAHLSRECQLE